MFELVLEHRADKGSLDFEVANSFGEKIHISAGKSLGGNGKDYRPMELLLTALASCSSFDLVIILNKKKILFKNLKITVSGERVDSIPSVFSKIHLNYSIESNLEKDVFEKVINLALHKYCSVRSMLKDNVVIDYSTTILAY